VKTQEAFLPAQRSNNQCNARSGLRSSSTSSMDYTLPLWVRTKLGEREFSHADPASWNALPDHSAPWLILPSYGNCLNHNDLVKFLTFADFCVLAFGQLL